MAHAKPVVEVKDKLLLTLLEASALSNIDAEVIRDACRKGQVSYTVTSRNQKIFVTRRSLEDWVEYLCRMHEEIDVAAARKSNKERLRAAKVPAWAG